MEKLIIQRLYLKTIFAGVAGVTLCVLASFMSNTWSTVWMAGIVVAAAAFTILSLRHNVKQSKVVFIYARCYNFMGKPSFIKSGINSRVTYHFFVKNAEAILSNKKDNEEDNDASTSIYIKGEMGKFIEGELYCILFKKSLNNSYNEQNLLAYDIVQQDIITFTADDGIGKPSDDCLRPNIDIEDTDNIIVFKSLDENK